MGKFALENVRPPATHRSLVMVLSKLSLSWQVPPPPRPSQKNDAVAGSTRLAPFTTAGYRTLCGPRTHPLAVGLCCCAAEA